VVVGCFDHSNVRDRVDRTGKPYFLEDMLPISPGININININNKNRTKGQYGSYFEAKGIVKLNLTLVPVTLISS